MAQPVYYNSPMVERKRINELERGTIEKNVNVQEEIGSYINIRIY